MLASCQAQRFLPERYLRGAISSSGLRGSFLVRQAAEERIGRSGVRRIGLEWNEKDRIGRREKEGFPTCVGVNRHPDGSEERHPMPRPLAKFVEHLTVAVRDFDAKFYDGGRGFNFSSQAVLLHVALQAAVPLWAQELERRKERPGEGFADHLQERAGVCASVVCEHGDHLLFKSKKSGQSAEVFNRLAEGLACLSFCPGGVTFLGIHWEYKKVRVDLK